jgi:hypothetical protein
MYNIHSHYKFIYEYAKQFQFQIKLAYFFPFGSSNYTNIEYLESSQADLNLLCFDQEPIIFANNFEMVFKYDKKNRHKNFFTPARKQTGYSKLLQCEISLDTVPSVTNKKIPTILLNTEKDSKEKNKLLNHFHYVDCYYFFHGLAAADWYRGYEYYKFTPINQRKIKKKYITYNRITGNSRIYRLFFIALLFEKNLIEFGHISFSKKCPEHGNLIESLLLAKKNYNLNSSICQKTIKIHAQLQELRIDSSADTNIENNSFDIGAIAESMQSFLHVVTETCFWEEKKHLTEKIFKPIVLKQPFVLIGCANNLAYLKEYGFRTFDRWWDESYDTCEDPLDRLEMVVSIIENICKKSNDELQSMLLEMEEVLEYNFNRFYSKDFVKDIWDELSTNLTSAIAQLPPLT